MSARLSVVIPVLNDAAGLTALLAQLETLAPEAEVIVADGGSDDDSRLVARRGGAILMQSSRGRGRQLNTGVAGASGDWIWLLHADTRVGAAALDYLRELRAPGWGRFDVAFDPPGAGMALTAAAMNRRSRLTGICTGDQGIFAHRNLLMAVGGVPEQALMEDIELSRRLKRLGPPLCPRIPLITSARRWRRDGWLRTVLGMWWLRLRYWWGADPEVLARAYYR